MKHLLQLDLVQWVPILYNGTFVVLMLRNGALTRRYIFFGCTAMLSLTFYISVGKESIISRCKLRWKKHKAMEFLSVIKDQPVVFPEMVHYEWDLLIGFRLAWAVNVCATGVIIIYLVCFWSQFLCQLVMFVRSHFSAVYDLFVLIIWWTNLELLSRLWGIILPWTHGVN